ncbi:unnamed protein product, partial [Trichogramma brassicae]
MAASKRYIFSEDCFLSSGSHIRHGLRFPEGAAGRRREGLLDAYRSRGQASARPAAAQQRYTCGSGGGVGPTAIRVHTANQLPSLLRRPNARAFLFGLRRSSSSRPRKTSCSLARLEQPHRAIYIGQWLYSYILN